MTTTIIGRVIVCCLIFTNCSNSKKRHYYEYNPRSAINGKDTVYTDDSIFIIRVVVDSAIEKEKEYDHPDPRG